METLDDAIIVRHELHERLTITVVVEPQVDRRFDRTAKACMIEHGSKAGHDSAINEALDPRTSRIWTQPNRSTNLTMGHSGITLQTTEDFSVDFIYHSATHHISGRYTAFSVPPTADFPS